MLSLCSVYAIVGNRKIQENMLQRFILCLNITYSKLMFPSHPLNPHPFQRTQTNPFIAPSLRNPSSSNHQPPSNACNLDQSPSTTATAGAAFAGRSGPTHQPHMVQSSSSSSTASASSQQLQQQQHRRPVRLPLRKHHTFHFQSSQTVAGAHRSGSGSRQAASHQQHAQQPAHHQTSLVPGSSAARRHYRANGGPLVFKPFSEETAFKPITPVPKSPSGDAMPHLVSHTMPRNGGNSLRRHMSNVETTAGVAAAAAAHHRRRHRGGQQDECDGCEDIEFDEDDAGDDFDDDDDDADGAEDSTPSSSASARTAAHLAASRKLHYADLTPLQCRSDGSSAGSGSTTGHGRASTAPVTTSSTSSAEEQHHQQIAMKMGGRALGGRNQAIVDCGPSLKSTQYATLKYSEVNM